MFIFVFLVFLFLHFAFAQYDAVAYAAACLMRHPVSLPPLWTSLLLTVLSFGLISGIRKLLSPRRLGLTAACVATGWLAAAGLSLPFASALWQAGLLIVAVGMVLADRQYNLRLLRLWGPERTLWQKFMPRAIELLVLCLYVGAGTAVSDVEHFELRTAQALRSDHPEEAYHIGEVDLAASPRLFAMRCYLLATHHPKGLGDKLLQQPVPAGGSDNLLLPDDERQRLLLPTDSLFTDRPAVSLTDEGAERIARGAVVFPRQTDSLPETADTICRVYHQDKFLMLGQVRELDKGGLGLFVYKNFR